jgi:hypothetical protein
VPKNVDFDPYVPVTARVLGGTIMKPGAPMDRQKRMIKKATFFGTINAVLCAFVGIRKSGNLVVFNPVFIVAAGLMGVALFVALLIIIVRSIV